MSITRKFTTLEYADFEKWLDLSANTHYKASTSSNVSKEFIEVSMSNEANIEYSIWQKITNDKALKETVKEEIKKGWWGTAKEYVRSFIKGIFVGAGKEAYEDRGIIIQEGKGFIQKVKDLIDDDDWWDKIWDTIKPWFDDLF
jgi:hypothetical protein